MTYSVMPSEPSAPSGMRRYPGHFADAVLPGSMPYRPGNRPAPSHLTSPLTCEPDKVR
ncbi:MULTISPECIES: hypothetical protein [Streptomyces]|uniref:hypothetical protein n=1 Tax=Streptomyces TaxID=1883 RepID=UPI00293072A2|nr:hypothetical protein [Streptomyces sp. NEAU-HV9]